MFSLIVFSSLMLTFTVCMGLSSYLWRSRHSELHRLVLFTQVSYAMWAFLVLGTMIVPETSAKILLTQLRQTFLPALGPTWLLITVAIFYRPFWDRIGRWRYLIYIWPAIVIVGHTSTILGLPFADNISFHDFKIGENPWGLLSYKMGWLIRASFSYIGLAIIAIHIIYLFVIVTKPGAKRKYAILLLGTGSIHVALEFTGRLFLNNVALIQLSVASIWPAALALHYAVSRLELLDIGALAQESIFENLPSPIVICDTHGGLWNANRSAFAVLNLHTSQIGRPVEQIPLLNRLSSPDGFIEIQEEKYQIVQQELSLKGGEECARIYILNNVTDLQESKEALQALNEQILGMMNFNRRVQTILSHDLSGALSGVNLLLKGVESKLSKSPNSEIKHSVNELSQANQSSLALLRDILAWSHKEESALHANLNESIEGTLKHLAPQIMAKKIQIQTALPTSDIYLPGSNKVLESIFRNLLSNAIKFSNPGGKVEINAHAENDSVRISVMDQGIGISQDKILQILSGQRTSVESQGGFGLGLTFTLDFIKQLQGKLEIESELGQGSCFILTLPRIENR